jgi:hypothetical protein
LNVGAGATGLAHDLIHARVKKTRANRKRKKTANSDQGDQAQGQGEKNCSGLKRTAHKR